MAFCHCPPTAIDGSGCAGGIVIHSTGLEAAEFARPRSPRLSRLELNRLRMGIVPMPGSSHNRLIRSNAVEICALLPYAPNHHDTTSRQDIPYAAGQLKAERTRRLAPAGSPDQSAS